MTKTKIVSISSMFLAITCSSIVLLAGTNTIKASFKSCSQYKTDFLAEAAESEFTKDGIIAGYLLQVFSCHKEIADAQKFFQADPAALKRLDASNKKFNFSGRFKVKSLEIEPVN